MNLETAAYVATVAMGFLAVWGAVDAIRRSSSRRKARVTSSDALTPVRYITPFASRDARGAAIPLLSYIWEFPERSPQKGCWAVKESAVLRGKLDEAAKNPGLGIALFVTDLAREAFGPASEEKIRNCVSWGVRRLSTRFSPPLILERETAKITGVETEKGDARHSIALGILMARAGVHSDLQQAYLLYLLENQTTSGAWVAFPGDTSDDLPTVTYALEFLSLCARGSTHADSGIDAAISRAKGWMDRASTPEGGWIYTSFPDESWQRLWTTSYIALRLQAAELERDPEWTRVLNGAARVIAEDAGSAQYYRDEMTRFRIEARAAAALVALTSDGSQTLPIARKAETWLELWRERCLYTLASIPKDAIDLATATFAVRGLIPPKELGDFQTALHWDAAGMGFPRDNGHSV